MTRGVTSFNILRFIFLVSALCNSYWNFSFFRQDTNFLNIAIIDTINN
jgi:hypothetical protein